jgi:hypothetical protein
MPPIVNIKDFFVVGVMAFTFILIFSAALRKAGMSNFTITGA